MEFNEKLQELRKKKGLTQEELAEALYVSRTAISKWESGRGYPNINSLKAISKLFSVTIDELLLGEELLTIAEEENKQTQMHLCDLLFGLLDASVFLLFFSPFFAQRIGGTVYEAPLLSLSEISPWLKISYVVLIALTIISGILTLAFQNCTFSFWVKHKSKLSLALNTAGTLLFILSLQPYPAILLFSFLIIKVCMLLKCK